MKFADLVTSDIRLGILQVLAQDAGYACNEAILQSALNLLRADNVSRDKVRTEMDWLSEQGLITVEAVMDVKLAKLTNRGLDVAKGCSVVTGVRRPDPEECK